MKNCLVRTEKPIESGIMRSKQRLMEYVEILAVMSGTKVVNNDHEWFNALRKSL